MSDGSTQEVDGNVSLSASETVGRLVELLQPLSSDDRRRVVQASLILLGETPVQPSRTATDAPPEHDDLELSPRGRIWIKQNGVTQEQLEHVFHFGNSGAVDVIGAVPGKNEKEKTLNCYVLTGIASLLSSGEPKFDDSAARALCQSAGCYGPTNHATYLKNRGNEFTGSKASGWTLTAPGLKRASALVKEIAEG